MSSGVTGSMKYPELEPRFRKQLASAGFAFERPDPAVAWAVFRRFLAEPLEEDAGALVEAGTGSDGTFFFNLVRQSSPGDAFWQLRLDFNCGMTERLKSVRLGSYLGAKPDGALFGLERLQDFHAVLAHPGPWQCALESVRMD